MSGVAARWVIGDPSHVGWFADALRDVMAEQQLSVGAVARKVETSPSLVRKWRAGTAVPSVERAAQIARALDVSYARLCLPAADQPAAGGGQPLLDLVEELGDPPAASSGQRAVEERRRSSGRRASDRQTS